MIEREMEYRGSKLDNLSVKEQRVDGHRCDNLTYLRHALMGSESSYQIKILSNQINTSRRSYTSISTNLLCNSSDNLNPWFLTGFWDAESNFTVRITKSNSVKVGWTVQPVFQIDLHKRDLNLLEKIRTFLGVGE